MKCRRCSAAAVVEVRRHNAAYCKDCFVHVFRGQVERAIDRWDMLRRDDRILVAVSGGKDSLALWDVLLRLGYRADGLYLGLGIGSYSDRSARVTEAFAAERGATLVVVDLAETYGYDIPTAGRKGSRSTCAVCGLSKRYVFNRAALDGGYDVVATGHNLDDEAAVLFGNTLNWQGEYLLRQGPVLPESPGLARKVKPLFRFYERDMTAYALLRGIEYIYEECPYAVGSKTTYYKELLNQLETERPGAKLTFYIKFLEARANGLFGERVEGPTTELHPCTNCGQPTSAPGLCSFCRLVEKVKNTSA